ncbi:MAG: Mu-like prophage major head subunit gpT family protein [Deltaproteobacteria bacterium]|nr:Mu-like prophage major head subunit gpT family protein [Deltaproteobacteria bacterium]
MIVNQANLEGIYKSFSTIFNEAFQQTPTDYEKVAMTVPSTGRSIDYKWLADFPTMREWLGDRVIKDISAFHYEITNKDFEVTIGVNRNDIDDDQIGIYNPIIRMLAHQAKIHPDDLVFKLLAAAFETECYDGQYFIDSDHEVNDASVSNDGGGSGNPWFLMDLSKPIKPLILQRRKNPEFVAMDSPTDENVFMRKEFRYGVDDRKNVGFGLWQLAYGSKDTLDATTYAAARAAMMAFKKDDGSTPLGIRPTHLVCGPTNESTARTLIDIMNNAAGAGNPWYHTVELIITPWLT